MMVHAIPDNTDSNKWWHMHRNTWQTTDKNCPLNNASTNCTLQIWQIKLHVFTHPIVTLAHAVEWVNGLGGGTLEDTHPLRQKEGGATPCTLGGGGTLHTSTAALCRRHQISRLTKHYKKNYSYSLFIRHILLSKVCSRFIFGNKIYNVYKHIHPLLYTHCGRWSSGWSGRWDTGGHRCCQRLPLVGDTPDRPCVLCLLPPDISDIPPHILQRSSTQNM